MDDESSNIISETYSRNESKSIPNQHIIKKNRIAKYQIFDEYEFVRGRQVLGDMIVHGMMTSGGTDIDWLIEHNGCFLIFEFKGFHNDSINIPKGQIIAYEELHKKLNQVSRCYLYIVGCDDIDFSNPDAKIWIFEMNQWKNGAIPKNTVDVFNENLKRQNKYIVFREYFDEITVEELRYITDKHWKEFELSTK